MCQGTKKDDKIDQLVYYYFEKGKFICYTAPRKMSNIIGILKLKSEVFTALPRFQAYHINTV